LGFKKKVIGWDHTTIQEKGGIWGNGEAVVLLSMLLIPLSPLISAFLLDFFSITGTVAQYLSFSQGKSVVK
jgi:hypothetical protein